LLQGSSGSGKSSFLRAGLIPSLKQLVKAKVPPRWTPVLLDVIRCTADPLVAIGTALRRAMADVSPLSPHGSGLAERGSVAVALEDATRKWIVEKLDSAPLMSKTRAHALAHDEEVAKKEYHEFAGIVIEVLAKLSQSPDIKLFIFIDQAEEVLTKTTGTQRAKPPTKGFFYFLEELCFQDINLRIVVSLRTEFYGRFRDEFAISEQPVQPREKDSKKENLVESFLLKPLRDEERLLRAFRYPTIAVRSASGNEVPAYPFHFEDGLLETIIRDVLGMTSLGNASVTPLISMICADLHSRLPNGRGTIRKIDYPADQQRPGAGVVALLRAYLARGIGKVAEPESGRALRWEELLFETLVSRQGGGTVVSMTEDITTFVNNARTVGLEAADRSIRGSLSALAHGDAPLLREVPIGDGESQYSLKHDAVAVILDRRREARLGSRREAERAKDEYDRAEKEKYRAEQERFRADKQRLLAESEAVRAKTARSRARTNAVVAVLSFLTTGIIIFGSGYMITERNKNLLQLSIERDKNINLWARARIDLIDRTNLFAMRPTKTSELEDLDILIGNLVTSQQAIDQAKAKNVDDKYVKLLQEVHNDTLNDLRNIVARADRLVFKCVSAGYDYHSKQLACLENDAGYQGNSFALKSYKLAKGDEENTPSSECYNLPKGALEDTTQLWARKSVGFMGEAGIALYFEGHLYHWSRTKDDNGCFTPLPNVDLKQALALLGPTTFPPLPEFDNGWLTIRNPPFPPSGLKTSSILRFDASIFDIKDPGTIGDSIVYKVPHVALPDALPHLYSWNGTVSFAYLEQASSVDKKSCAELSGTQSEGTVECKAVWVRYGEAGHDTLSLDLQPPGEVGADWAFPQAGPQRRWTFAFVSQAETLSAADTQPPLIAAKGPGRTVTLRRLVSRTAGSNGTTGNADLQHLSIDLTDAFHSVGLSDRNRELRRSWRLASSPYFIFPPLAAAQPDNQNWALAWVSETGLWFARSVPQDRLILRSPFPGTLFGGDTDGIRLQISDDAEQLFLFAQPRTQGAGTVRVYDVRPQWIKRVLGQENPLSEAEIFRRACAIERRDSATGTDSQIEREPGAESDMSYEAEPGPAIRRQNNSPCGYQPIADANR
jgi:hypothetical protein